ncbi:MAG: ABC transporter ATP-binding protein [Elusimicrobia bacterium]|nr:ABC transporter ATP-binding protein [Elusimicrobiota bacterium]
MTVLTSLFDMASVLSMVPFFGLLTGASISQDSGGLKDRLINGMLRVLPGSDPLTGTCFFIIALSILRFLNAVLSDHFVARIAGAQLYGFKKRVLDTYANAPYQHFIDTKQGKMTNVLLADCFGAAYLLQKLPKLLSDCMRIAALTAILLWLNYRVTLCLVLVGAFLFFLLNQLQRLFYHYGVERVRAHEEEAVIFNEFVNGIKQLSTFRVKDRWVDRFNRASRRYIDAYTKNMTLLSTTRPFLDAAALTVVFGSIILINYFSHTQIAAHLPLLASFAMAAVQMVPTFSHINQARMEIMGYVPQIESLHAELAVRPASQPRSRKSFEGLRSSIRFEALRFSYPGRDEIIGGLDLRMERHKTTALIGGSGSGKTTLLNILLGLYRPTGGRVLIDEVDLDELDPDSWLSRIAVVSQDTFLFHGTVLENVAFGRERFSIDQVREAARIAQACDFIDAMPNGFDTVVGERGMKLSGGQQQRLAIARAVLGNPEILVFDEATSALDSHSEVAVQAAIQAVSAGRTVIQVSHRLSTVAGSDKIALIAHGRIEEQGTPSELERLGGRYANLLKLQNAAVKCG